MREWIAALDGYAEKHGGGEDQVEAMDRATLERLMQEYPDG